MCLKSSGELIQKNGQMGKTQNSENFFREYFSAVLMNTHLFYFLVFRKPIKCFKFPDEMCSEPVKVCDFFF